MNKIFLQNLIIRTTVLFFVFTPQSTFSAELNFKTQTDGKTSIVEVSIDPQVKNLNVVEGTLEFSGEASNGLSVQVENGQSVLPLWPTAPQYDDKSKSITFVGGVPNGFDKEGLLFRLRITPTVKGDLKITYTNGVSYLNDGKGTKESISSKPLEIYTDKSELNNTKENKSDSNKNKYVIIILLTLIIISFLFKYVIKNHKK